MDKKRVPIFTSTSFAAKSVPQVASSKQTDLLFSYLRTPLFSIIYNKQM